MKTKCIYNRAMRSCCLLATLLLVFSATGCVESDTAAKSRNVPGDSPVSSNANSSPDDTFAESKTCKRSLRFWRDYSGSTDEEMLGKISDDIVSAIRKNKSRICGIEVVRFSVGNEPISRELAEKFIWGEMPLPEEFRPNLEQTPPEVRMFQREREKYVRKQREAYDQKTKAELAAYNVRVERAVKNFELYLLTPPSQHSGCTRFFSLAKRVSTENLAHNVTISDGWNDCDDERKGDIPNFRIDGQHSIIQLARSSDSQENESDLKHRSDFLRRLFPDAYIFSGYEASKAVESLF